jgi:hypothetical protein
MASILCCTLDDGILSDIDQCALPTGGIDDVRIACARLVSSVTKVDCPDGRISAIATVDDTATTAPAFHRFEVKPRQSSQAHEQTYDADTDAYANTETITLVINVFTKAAYCVLYGLIGQQVACIWKRNGTDTHYVSGYAGGLFVTSVTGGTGTDSLQSINVTLFNPRVEGNRFLPVEAATPTATATLLSTITV